jgi:hypothetical protein
MSTLASSVRKYVSTYQKTHGSLSNCHQTHRSLGYEDFLIAKSHQSLYFSSRSGEKRRRTWPQRSNTPQTKAGRKVQRGHELSPSRLKTQELPVGNNLKGLKRAVSGLRSWRQRSSRWLEKKGLSSFRLYSLRVGWTVAWSVRAIAFL